MSGFSDHESVLYYWVRRADANFTDYGFLKVPLDTLFGEIRERIYAKCQLPAGSPEDAVRLYKVPAKYPVNILDINCSTVLEALSISQLGSSIRISQTLSSIFPPTRKTEKVQEDQSQLHLIIDLPEIQITCWARGAHSSQQFAIVLPRNARLSSLKPAAVENFSHLRDSDASSLNLYTFTYQHQDELNEILDRTGEGHFVSNEQTVETASNTVPFSSTLKVVVERAAPPLCRPFSSHAPCSPESPIRYERENFLKINEAMQPSQSGGPESFRKRQGQDHKVIPCGRPREPEDRVPTVLLDPVFGKFIQDSKHIKTTADDHRFACNFAFAMSAIYGDENYRAAAIRRMLAEYSIHCVVSKVVNTAYETDGQICVDGHTYVLVEFKNEVGSGGAEPYFQSIGYYVESTRETALKMTNSALPCLLLCIFGPYIVFAGAAWNLRPTVQLLSMPIACHFHSTENDKLLVLARHMAAFRDAVETLKQHYETLKPESTSAPQIFPYRATYTSQIDANLKHIIYKEQPSTEKLVFFGFEDSEKGRPICIKFVRQYSPEAHKYCASLGCAPTLLGFDVIPGDWFMVVMDDIRAGHETLYHAQRPKSKPESKSTVTTHWQPLIEAKLAEFHRGGFVHGDIRNTNIMVSRFNSTDFKIIDFDWSGEANGAVYPMLVNTEKMWRPDGAIDGEPILAKHDIEMLDDIWNPRRRLGEQQQGYFYTIDR